MTECTPTGWLSPTSISRRSRADARSLFSTKDAQYAFGETDDDGKRNIETFAARHQSVVSFMPVEERVYFLRDPNAATSVD